MKKTILLPKKVKQQIASASKVASYLWQREWAECNGHQITPKKLVAKFSL